MKTSKIETLGVLDIEVSNLAAHAKSIDYLTGEVFGGSKFGKELSSIKSSIRNYTLKYQEECEGLVKVRSKYMEVLYIGYYKPYINDDGIMVLDTVTWAFDPMDPNTCIISCRLTACGDDIAKVMELNTFDIIAGKFDYVPLTFRNNNRFEISTAKTTDFTPRNEMAGNDLPLQVRKDTILGAYPIISLAEMGDNLSKQIKGKDKQYTDTLDLRHVKCVIASYNEGFEDVTMTVADSSIAVSDNSSPITVRVSSSIAHHANCGEGSFVHILGYIARNKKGYPEMTACAIVPIKRVSMEKSNVR